MFLRKRSNGLARIALFKIRSEFELVCTATCWNRFVDVIFVNCQQNLNVGSALLSCNKCVC